MIKPQYWILLGVIALGLASPAHSKEKVLLKADALYYRNQNRELVATSNAIMTIRDLTIQADSFVLNTDTNTVTGAGDIIITQDNQDIHASSLIYDIHKNSFVADDLDIIISPLTSTHDIYIQAENIQDDSTIKTGQNGLITTCDYDPPHYYMHAKSFIYIPNERLIGQDVYVHNPALFLPLSFWSPAYIFELGKRQVVYLMPAIGSNEVEGGFFKSTFDYYFGEDRYGKVYVDFMSNRGTGLGVDHHYQLSPDVAGSIYQYNVSGQKDRVTKWDQQYQLSDQLSVGHSYLSKDMYLISGGRTQRNGSGFDINYDDLGDTHKVMYSETHQDVLNAKSSNRSFNYNHQYNDVNELNLRVQQSDSSVKNETYTLNQQQYYEHDFHVSNRVNLRRNELSSNHGVFDENLRTTTIITRPFEGWGTSTTELSLFFDTDESRVTQDVNTYVQKLPESIFKVTPIRWGLLSFHETITIGRYEEAYLIPSSGEIRNFSANRTILDQKVSTRFTNLPLSGSLGLSLGYEQFLYSTGDENYKTSINADYGTDWFGFFQTRTDYSRSIIPEEGQSPFYFDEREQLDINQVRESFTLYAISPAMYKWVLSSGYDWNRDEQMDYKSEINIQPNPQFRTNFRTGYRIKSEQYDPLTMVLRYRLRRSLDLSFRANHDLNLGELIYLSNSIDFTIGDTWQDRWIVGAHFTYQPQVDDIYQLQSLSLTKDLHRRKLTLTYNKLLEEYRLHFTIDAFPEDSLGLSTNENESLKLEGVFDDQSLQR